MMKDFNYKICLIGMPGSGKTTIGKDIAKEINYDFIDLDQTIEKILNKKIRTIFKINGERFFRKTESDLLKNIIKNKQKVIISTGGGIILNNEKILESCFNIYLKCSSETLIKRVNKNNQRPLITSDIKKDINELLIKREKIYSKLSNLTVQADGLKKDTIESIIKKIK